MPARIMMFVASPLLIAPNIVTDAVGLCGIALVLGYQLWRRRSLAVKNGAVARE